MGHALGNVLPLAVAVAVFPVPIIAAVLIVGSDRGVAKGLAFLLAWGAGLGAVGTIGLLIGGVAGGSDAREPAVWVNVLLLVLGVVLLWLAVKQWRARPSGGGEPPVPGWVRTVGDLTVAKAAGAGFALSALNPKNALLAIAAAAEIIEAGLSASQQVVVLVVFVVIASVGVLAPVATFPPSCSPSVSRRGSPRCSSPTRPARLTGLLGSRFRALAGPRSGDEQAHDPDLFALSGQCLQY